MSDEIGKLIAESLERNQQHAAHVEGAEMWEWLATFLLRDLHAAGYIEPGWSDDVDANTAVVDTRDEAVRLIERIAEKYVEPFAEGNDDKTIGCWRHELNALLYEAVEYENRRRARASAYLSAISEFDTTKELE